MSIAAKLIKDALSEQKSSGHAEGEIKVPKYGNDHTPNNHVDNKNMKVVKSPAKGLDQRNDKKPKADVGQAHKERGRDHRTIRPKVSEQRLVELKNPNPIVKALNLQVVENGQYLTFSNPKASGEIYKLPWGGTVRSAVTKFVVNDDALTNPARAASELYERLASQRGVELAQPRTSYPSAQRRSGGQNVYQGDLGQIKARANDMSLMADIGDSDVGVTDLGGLAGGNEEKIEQLRAIVENGQYAEVDGQTVDLFSASAVVQVYDALSNPQYKAKLAAMPVSQMVDIAFKVMKRAEAKESAGGGTATGELSVPSYSDYGTTYSKKNRSNQPLDDKNKGEPGMVKKSEKRAGKDGLMDANPAKVDGPKIGRGQIAEQKALESLLGRELQLDFSE